MNYNFVVVLLLSAILCPREVNLGPLSLDEARVWFAENYQPRFEFGDAGQFLVDETNEFTPYRVIPLWDEAFFVMSGKGKKRVEEVHVPVIAERQIKMGFRIKGQNRKSEEWELVPCRQYLIIARKRRRLSAWVRTLRSASPDSTQFTGVMCDSELNTGLSRTLYYYREGALLIKKEFNAVEGTLRRPNILLEHVGDTGRRDPDQQPYLGVETHRYSEAYRAAQKQAEMHNSVVKAHAEPTVVYRVLGVAYDSERSE